MELPELPDLLNQFAEIDAIKDPLKREYVLTEAAMRYADLSDNYRRLFELYCKKQSDIIMGEEMHCFYMQI